MTVSVNLEKDPRISLHARRTLDGNVLIFDHEDIDIVLSVESKKCVTFPKDTLSDKVYSAQDRMFGYLAKRGVIDRASIRGGNVHGSMECSMLESKVPGVDPLQACLYAIHEYITQERPFFRRSQEIDDAHLDNLLRPGVEDSTELGDVPHSAQKGSHGFTRGPYGFMYNYSLVRENKEEEE
jgi:hypothetical protein